MISEHFYDYLVIFSVLALAFAVSVNVAMLVHFDHPNTALLLTAIPTLGAGISYALLAPGQGLQVTTVVLFVVFWVCFPVAIAAMLGVGLAQVWRYLDR